MRTQTLESFSSKTEEPNFNLRTWSGRFMKRAFDIVASAFGLLLLSPLFLFISIIIKRDSSGPVFYRGPRIGRNNQPFRILKFRTMREDAASYCGPRVTAGDDPRITQLGKWLRDSKINEFPQLWNVFVGEMSMVGPRPEDPELMDTWSPEVRSEVLSVRPGITSPASVLFRDEEKMLNTGSLMDTYLEEILPSKLRLDQLYVRHQSFLLDLDVLFWTALVVVVPSLREHKPPEDTLFWGPISRFVRRYLSWFLIDTLTTFFAFGLAGSVERVFVAPLDVGLMPAIVISFGYSILFSSVAALMGVQKISWASAPATDAQLLVPPIIVAFIAAFALNSWQGFLPPNIVLDATVVAFLGYFFMRYRSRILTGIFSQWITLRSNKLLVRERVLIVGAGDTGQFAAWRLMHNQEAPNYQVVGFVDDDMYRQGVRLNGFTVLGKREDIVELVRKHDIGVIIFAIHNITALERESILKACRSTNAHVITWPNTVSLLRASSMKGKSNTTPVPVGSLSGIKGSLIIQWLDMLESDLNQGDFEQVMEDIHSMRTALQKKNSEEKTTE